MKFVHVYDPQWPKPGVTIAYEIGDADSTRVVSIGASFSSPMDTYSKRMGRQISGQRLRTQPLQFTFDEKPDIHARHVISLLHIFLLGVDFEQSGQPLHPSRFYERRVGDMIGPDGHALRVGFDTGLQGVGWMTRAPSWAKKFLSSPP